MDRRRARRPRAGDLADPTGHAHATRAQASAYAGRRVALATMHAKQVAFAPPLRDLLDLQVHVPEGIDTDALGTFTREIPRAGSMHEAALAKARLGMAAAGLPLGLASEGSYGPHPEVPWVPVGRELVVFVDDERGLLVTEQLVDEAPVFAHVEVSPGDDLSAFLRRVRFPDHGLAVGPVVAGDGAPAITKGVRSVAALEEAVRRGAERSEDGRARVETDMRAHMNPARMAALGRLAERLARRLHVRCARCDAPGFGPVDTEHGLPCAACGTPSRLVLRELHGCAACAHREPRPRPDGLPAADPMHCDMCNP